MHISNLVVDNGGTYIFTSWRNLTHDCRFILYECERVFSKHKNAGHLLFINHKFILVNGLLSTSRKVYRAVPSLPRDCAKHHSIPHKAPTSLFECTEYATQARSKSLRLLPRSQNPL